MVPLVRIGTRRSKLALTQSGMMQRAIGRALGVADADSVTDLPAPQLQPRRVDARQRQRVARRAEAQNGCSELEPKVALRTQVNG
jgi:hypothetical protein